MMLASCTGADGGAAESAASVPARPRPGAAARGPFVETLHGTVVADPYRWMERSDADATRRFAHAWNVAARAWLASLPGRPTLRERVDRLRDRERLGVPVRRGLRSFHSYRDGLESRDVWMASEAFGTRGQVFLDPDAAPLDGRPIPAIWPGPGGDRVAYVLARPGAPAHALRIRDVSTGRDLPEILEGVAAGVAPAWAASGAGFYYGRHTMLPRGSGTRATQVAVWYHRLGTEQTGDALVYRPADPLHDAQPYLPGGRYLVVKLVGERGDEILALDLAAEAPRWRTVLGSDDGRHDLVGADGRRLFLRTTGAAPRGRVVIVDPRSATAPLEVLPERDVTLSAVVLAGGRLVAVYAADGRTGIRLHELDGTRVMDIELPESGSVSELTAAPDAPEAYYRLSPLGGPATVYRLDTTAGTSRPLWGSESASTAPEHLVERQRLAADDGAWVALSLVSRSEVRRTGDNPVLLTPRGSSATVEPGERTLRASWIAGGGVLAVVDVRDGGSSPGRPGDRHGTESAVADLVSAADWLIASGVTRTPRLAVGGSGPEGLLAAAALTRRPDLFAAALPGSAPHDLLRYQLAPAVPRPWLEGYGTAVDPDAFPILHRVSPVHAAGNEACYPATLITAAPGDTAPPWHAYKLAASLDHAQTCAAPVLLRISAGDGTGERTEEVVDRLAFLHAILGLEARTP